MSILNIVLKTILHCMYLNISSMKIWSFSKTLHILVRFLRLFRARYLYVGGNMILLSRDELVYFFKFQNSPWGQVFDTHWNALSRYNFGTNSEDPLTGYWVKSGAFIKMLYILFRHTELFCISIIVLISLRRLFIQYYFNINKHGSTDLVDCRETCAREFV